MRIFSPDDIFVKDYKDLIFLAGPCPREHFENDWRIEAIDLFKKYNFSGDIANPTNDHYDNNLFNQTNWEVETLYKSSLIFCWIPRDIKNKHYALTTNIEFGEFLDSNKIIVGFPDDSDNNDYLRIRCEMYGIKVYNNLDDMVKEAVKRFNKKENCFFTSDTHFFAERTFTLSKRPFVNLKFSDLNIISRWNSVVTSNDIVYHLGDFGNGEYVSFLNFKKMYLVAGNYEKKYKVNTGVLLSDPRVELLKDKEITIDGNKYVLTHEPITNKYGDDKFYLFGHIHASQRIKSNGINVGIDANNYYPVSKDKIIWLKNAIDNHFDDNVFTPFCY